MADKTAARITHALFSRQAPGRAEVEAALTAYGEQEGRRNYEEGRNDERGGLWPNGSRKAFVAGAKWWQFHCTGASAFASEVDEMATEAERRIEEDALARETKEKT